MNLFFKGIKAAWDKFDLNGDGTVSTSEVDRFLDMLDIKVPQSQQDKIIKQLDRYFLLKRINFSVN